MDKIKEKIIFPFKCPVCGKSEFEDVDWLLEEDKDVEVYTINESTGEKKLSDAIAAHNVHCEFCGWTYDLKQLLDFNVIGDRNTKTVNEQKKYYQNKIQENPNYIYDEEVIQPTPHICPICGEYEFENSNSYDGCPICGWIDDGTENRPLDDYSEVNVISIHEAKEEFKNKRKENPKYKWKNYNV
ncbi:MAG: hypothetical protein K6G38_05335 [Gammaproteobacteria bacterium]|nr:hypothetical protein [Gammaproteobacteria bacterium]